jgi:GNAT acetyltransferase
MTRLAALFTRHEPRAVVEAAVERRLGSVAADDPTDPTVAKLTIGCYAIVSGDPNHPLARDLVRDVTPPREIVYGNDPAWRRLVLDVHGAKVTDRPMTIFDASELDRDALARFACPAGYQVRRMDADDARQLDAGLEPHALQVFEGPEHFAREGLGYAIVASDGALACAATSYTVSSRHLEVAIATRAAHRGLGLAAVASAALMWESLERGLTPGWSASNPVSKRLAERLGYLAAGECEVLLLA